MRRVPVMILLILFGFWGGDDVYAQVNDIFFERVSLEEDFLTETNYTIIEDTEVTVYSILQDKQGFMWFGTSDGLMRYNGYELTIYRNDPNDSTTLSDNQVWSIYQDREGLLWIGTQNGLNKLDLNTMEFSCYHHDRSDSTTLSNNRIRAIYEDQMGYLWIGTYGGGLNRFDPKTKKFKRYQSDHHSQSISHNKVTCVFSDQAGILWVGTVRGLNRFDPETEQFSHYRADASIPTSLTHDAISCVYEDSFGMLWVGTSIGGLNQYDRTTNTFHHYSHDPSNPYTISHDHIVQIYEDNQRNLWIGTDGGGLNQFDRRRERFVNYQHNPYQLNSLSHNTILSLFEDESGNFWIGTEDGLNKFDLEKHQFRHYIHDHADTNSLTNDQIFVIYEDYDSALWIGTGNGLNKYDRQHDKFTRYRYNWDEASGGYTVTALCEDRYDFLWVGTKGGLEKFDPETENFTPYMGRNLTNCIYEDQSGVLWVGTTLGLHRFDRNTDQFLTFQQSDGLSNNRVSWICEGEKGMLWIGTAEGLNQFDPTAEIFEIYRHTSDPNSLIDDDVNCVYYDRQGFLWIGTTRGLSKFDQQNNQFTNYTQKQGLPHNTIYGILEDNQGNLWLSTGRGLSRFNPQTNVFRNYDERDGLWFKPNVGMLPDVYLKKGFARSRKSGEMFFGWDSGVNAFFPDRVRYERYVPPVVITAFKKFGTPVRFNTPITKIDVIELDYTDHYISFEFAVLDYTDPAKNQYEYKMEGIDRDWIENGTNRIVNYPNFRGKTFQTSFTFYVKGANKDGIWNEAGTSIELKIPPPPWQRWWAYLLYILLVVTSVLAYVQYKTRAQQRELEAKERELKREQQFSEQLKLANEQLQRADRQKAEANKALKRANHRLNTLLDGTREMASAREKFMAMVSAANAILSEIPVHSAVELHICFEKVNAKKDDRYVYFHVHTEPNTENQLQLKPTKLQDFEHSYSPKIPKFLSEELDFDQPDGCYLHENTLIVPAWYGNRLSGLIEIEGVDPHHFRDEDKGFVDTLSSSLAISLENISFSQELEEKVKERTQQLVESERQATLGQMAGMVAHEINNALSGINAPVEFILKSESLDETKIWHCWEEDEDGHELRDYLTHWRNIWDGIQEAGSMIQVAGVRTRTVVRDLEGLVGERSRNLGAVNVCESFYETIRMNQQLVENIEIVSDIDKKKVEVISTSGQIGQIFANLLTNSIRALKDKGHPQIQVHIYHRNGGIEIKFRDNGCGIPSEVQPQIFEPFFTTYQERGSSRQGRGLGLSIVKRIVGDHNGTIAVESEVDKGTTFTIWLPYDPSEK